MGFVWSYNDVVYVFVFSDNTLRKPFPPYSLVDIDLLGELVDSDDAIVAMVVDRIRIYEL